MTVLDDGSRETVGGDCQIYSTHLFDNRRLLSLLVLDEGSLLVVHLGSREPHDPSVDLHVSRSVSHSLFFSLNIKILCSRKTHE